METNDAYRAAKRHVERKIGFAIHLSVYVLVNAGLILTNVLFSPDKVWAVWPLFGWGIGLLFHGLATYLHGPGMNWKNRMIEQELKRNHASH
ncbi:2TM domain-containing protein [Herbaspirillum sp. GCM10030257]|uniref:2TM domain-containing protein n=1 Tax=Herbaspirillum sp. GCM10030257 TaxID=3273393 RepID=UPI003607FD55